MFNLLLEKKNLQRSVEVIYIYLEAKFGPLLKKLNADYLGSPPVFHFRLTMDVAPKDEIAVEILV